MNDSMSNRPPRRPRYRGTHPRSFQEKYKELQPDKYADDVAKIVAGGKTPAGTHRPIMVGEILDGLKPQPGDIAVDCTLGYGGHAAELLQAVQPGGKLIATDVDPIELPKTESRLRQFGFPVESLIVRRMNYAGVYSLIMSESPAGADVMLADLGLSSMQIDNPERGFTFKASGPLDMRMNPEHGQPASLLLSKLSELELATILAANADEPQAQDLSRAILKAHANRPLSSTEELASVVAESMQRKKQDSESLVKETIRRVFQALRIAVNDEFGALDSFLRQLPDCLKPGGRVAIITFHSGEDRRVKLAFKKGLREGVYCSASEDVIRPTLQEQQSNPRSTSAKLRIAVKAS